MRNALHADINCHSDEVEAAPRLWRALAIGLAFSAIVYGIAATLVAAVL